MVNAGVCTCKVTDFAIDNSTCKGCLEGEFPFQIQLISCITRYAAGTRVFVQCHAHELARDAAPLRLMLLANTHRLVCKVAILNKCSAPYNPWQGS